MPSRRISNWHYVYVLRSSKDGNFYIGYTQDLKARLKIHNAKPSRSLRPRLPAKLIYVEAGRSQSDALRRETYLKTTQGRRLLKLRLRSFLRKEP